MKLSQLKLEKVEIHGFEFEFKPVQGKHILPYGGGERTGNDYERLCELLLDVLVSWNFEKEDGVDGELHVIDMDSLLLLPSFIITDLSQHIMKAKITTKEQQEN